MKKNFKIVYTDCPSAIKPVAHAAENLPTPGYPSSFDKDS